MGIGCDPILTGSISKAELAFASSAPTLVRRSSDRVNPDAVIQTSRDCRVAGISSVQMISYAEWRDSVLRVQLPVVLSSISPRLGWNPTSNPEGTSRVTIQSATDSVCDAHTCRVESIGVFPSFSHPIPISVVSSGQTHSTTLVSQRQRQRPSDIDRTLAGPTIPLVCVLNELHLWHF